MSFKGNLSTAETPCADSI